LAAVRGPLGFLAALTSDGNDEQNRPAANVGAAFLVAAVVIALVGFKWLGSTDEPRDAIADSWALGNSTEAASGPTTIPPTPAAIAIRLGVETSSASEDGHLTTTPTTRPGTSPSTRPGSAAGSGTTGSSGTDPGTPGGGSGSPTTHTSNTITSSTSTTEDTTTTTEDTTTTSDTTDPPPDPETQGPRTFSSPDDTKLIHDLGEAVGALFG
jgi:hypothetical protein